MAGATSVVGYTQILYMSGAGYKDNGSKPSMPVASQQVEYGWR